MMESRDEVIRALTRHCGDGRLTLDELEDRIGEAHAAVTDEDLRHVLRELPAIGDDARSERPPRRAPTPRPRRAGLRPDKHDHDHERTKAIGALITIGGFVLLFNGLFWLAMVCWFVLPGLVLHGRRG